MQADELEREIRSYLEKRLGLAAVGRDQELVSSGLLDSGNLVRLATHVERVAGISIPDRDIDAEHFDSIAMIVEYAASRR
jgi:acyl carrier protein